MSTFSFRVRTPVPPPRWASQAMARATSAGESVPGLWHHWCCADAVAASRVSAARRRVGRADIMGASKNTRRGGMGMDYAARFACWRFSSVRTLYNRSLNPPPFSKALAWLSTCLFKRWTAILHDVWPTLALISA